MNTLKPLVLLPLVFAMGCATGLGKSLHQVTVLDPETRYEGYSVQKIKAEGTQTVTFFTGDMHFSDEAYASLLEQCVGGRIVNISTKFSTDLGFFAYKNYMFLEGECLRRAKSS